MIIDDKGRLFGKISVIDLFVVVTLILIVLVAYFKIGTNSKTAIKEKEQLIELTFFKGALEDFTANSLEIGAPVEIDAIGTFLGEIREIELGESLAYKPDINGIMKQSPMEGYSSVEFKTQVMGRISDGAVLINGNLYGNGSFIIIWAGKSKIQLHISNIAVVSE